VIRRPARGREEPVWADPGAELWVAREGCGIGAGRPQHVPGEEDRQVDDDPTAAAVMPLSGAVNLTSPWVASTRGAPQRMNRNDGRKGKK
jgi:hypothetical protein